MKSEPRRKNGKNQVEEQQMEKRKRNE